VRLHAVLTAIGVLATTPRAFNLMGASREACALRDELRRREIPLSANSRVTLYERRIPLSDLPADARDLSADKIAAYAKIETVPPEIIVRRNGAGWHVIDGRHRIAVARQRGDDDIAALDASSLFGA